MNQEDRLPERQKKILDLSQPMGRFAALVLLVAVFSLYIPINWPWGAVHSLKTPLDQAIPLVPAFVISYLFLFFPWVAGLLLWTAARNARAFLRLVLAFLVALFIAYVAYLFFQTAVARPEVIVHDPFTRMLKWIYSTDHRYNAFPSSHTMLTTIMFLATARLIRPGWKVLFGIVAVSIIASTLLIKQHYIADVLAGLAVGLFGWWASRRLLPYVFPGNPDV